MKRTVDHVRLRLGVAVFAPHHWQTRFFSAQAAQNFISPQPISLPHLQTRSPALTRDRLQHRAQRLSFCFAMKTVLSFMTD